MANGVNPFHKDRTPSSSTIVFPQWMMPARRCQDQGVCMSASIDNAEGEAHQSINSQNLGIKFGGVRLFEMLP